MCSEVLDYSVVRVKSLDGRLGTVREFISREGTTSVVVLFFDGQRLELPLDDVVPTGLNESPLDYYEVVEMNPDPLLSKEVLDMTGRLGVVVTIGLCEDGQTWSYTVQIQSGELVCFEGCELVSMSKRLTAEDLYGVREETLIRRISVDKHGYGTVIYSNLDYVDGGPTPLLIDLDQFKPGR